jgi:hypothetical protein
MWRNLDEGIFKSCEPKVIEADLAQKHSPYVKQLAECLRLHVNTRLQDNCIEDRKKNAPTKVCIYYIPAARRLVLLPGSYKMLSLFFVPTGILALPIPEISAHGLKILRCLKTQLLLCQGRISRQIRNVATSAKVDQDEVDCWVQKLSVLPPSNDLVFVFKSSCLAHSFDNLKNTHTPTFP